MKKLQYEIPEEFCKKIKKTPQKIATPKNSEENNQGIAQKVAANFRSRAKK